MMRTKSELVKKCLILDPETKMYYETFETLSPFQEINFSAMSVTGSGTESADLRGKSRCVSNARCAKDMIRVVPHKRDFHRDQKVKNSADPKHQERRRNDLPKSLSDTGGEGLSAFPKNKKWIYSVVVKFQHV